MEYTKETNNKTWTQQTWPGNPSMNLKAACKIFANPFNGRKVPVWVWGGGIDKNNYSYTVSAGANSDFSYTGGWFPDVVTDIETAQQRVDELYNTKKLFN